MSPRTDRRTFARFGLGIVVAALPIGPRPAGAIPATVDAPWWDGLSGHAQRELADHPELSGMDFWRWYEGELLDRVEVTHPSFPFRVLEERQHGFHLDPQDDSRDWLILVNDPVITLTLAVRDTADLDATLGRLVDALAAR